MTRRIERVNHLLREAISELLQRQVKDPRLGGFVTVTEVAASPDLRYARVFISVLGDDEEKRKTLECLNAASGFFRKELGIRLRLRRIPELNFRRDDSIDRAARVLQLMKQLSVNSEEDLEPGEH
jgi:ribosome-binding factor A